MPRHVLLLRGINVGRHNRIGMAPLRELLTGLGYADVATHLQSGNALVTTPEPAAAVVRAVTEGLADSFGLQVPVVVRSGEQLAAVVADDPLREVRGEPKKHFVVFLADAPEPAAVDRVAGMELTPDVAVLRGQELHLWRPTAPDRSPSDRVDWDRTLGVVGTARNWNTVLALAELSRASRA